MKPSILISAVSLAVAAVFLSTTAQAAPADRETSVLDNSKTAYCMQVLVRQGKASESSSYTVASSRCWVGSLPTFSSYDGTALSLSERKSKQ